MGKRKRFAEMANVSAEESDPNSGEDETGQEVKSKIEPKRVCKLVLLKRNPELQMHLYIKC